MVPALASVFNPEVTSLGRVTARSVWVRAVFRQVALSRRWCARFPPTKPEDRGTVPKQMFAIRLRLLRILLASPPLPMRLGLSWLSCSPPPDLPAVAEVVNPGSACHQTEAPHASRVERTRAAAQVRAPRTGFLDGCAATVVARSSKSPALCAAVTRHRNSPQHVKLLHRRGLVLRRGWSASPAFSRAYWIERRDYSDTGRFSVTEGACDRRDYFDEPPLNWANTSPRTQLEGPARMGSWQSSRSLSSVDDSEIPGPAAPNRKRQPTVLIPSDLACRGFARLR